jgi:hypothetical protein
VTRQASFFVLYILLEVPSQYFLKKIGPKYYLSGLLFGCGVGKSCASGLPACKREARLTIPIVDVDSMKISSHGERSGDSKSDWFHHDATRSGCYGIWSDAGQCPHGPSTDGLDLRSLNVLFAHSRVSTRRSPSITLVTS